MNGIKILLLDAARTPGLPAELANAALRAFTDPDEIPAFPYDPPAPNPRRTDPGQGPPRLTSKAERLLLQSGPRLRRLHLRARHADRV